MRVIGSVGEPTKRRNGWSQTLGDYVEQIWHGTSEYAVAVYSQVRLNCAECELEVDGASGMVRARYASATEPGGPEQLRVELRMGRNDVQKSIFEPGPDGFTSGVGNESLQIIKAIIEDPQNGGLYDDFVATATQDELDMLNLAIQGVLYRVIYQPVLIQSTTASGGFQWPDVNYLAGTLLTQNTLLGTLRAVPNFSMPSTANVPAPAPTGFAYAWKAAPPTYESSSDGHSNEVLEFEFGLWPTFLFGDPI